ncbi:ABC transporter ATP-binding protein/permease [Qipengyuania aquimaris]|uniref:ABC transporter ATP-binding protein n=1 Tax=Qipengyuania aquimaris TaxID=255984 RepID=UPI001C9875DD|nr:ABC transporter ATP-binding protein [Qipengyuania aquimaris]MBY6127432.1 ABC transporter ATP-binding protein/permease [Qipengyuania aquimaris]
MAFDRTLPALLVIGTRAATVRVLLLSLLGAASEGIGFVLLVPLIALAAQGGEVAALPFALPSLSLGVLLAVFVVLVILRSVADVARALAEQDLRARIVDGLRIRALDALLNANWRWAMTRRRGESEALLVTNVDRAGYAVEMAAQLVRLGFALLALALAAMVVSPAAALTGGAAAAFVLLLYRPLIRRARALGETLSRGYDLLYSRLGETLGAQRILKSFGREAQASQELSESLRELRRTEFAFVRDSAIGQAALHIGGAIMAAGLAWLALELLELELAIVLALAAIFVRALPLVGSLQSAMQGWSHASPAIADALSMIEAASEAAEPVSDGDAPRLTQRIELADVSFSHQPGRPALSGINLRIEAGEMLALTGRSGSGKSTLADVAAGLIAPDEGSISIDGAKLGEGARRAWRTRVAYVQQEPVLFSGTVRDNLLWAKPDASEDQLRAALKEAAADFVDRLPEGLDCDLGEGGKALSGGERQRIALARALLRDPDLIVLDEATSSVDSQSEEAIGAALHAMAGRRTVLAIAHRGLLTEIADRVVRLEQGRIASG